MASRPTRRPVFVPEPPPGAPQRDTTATLASAGSGIWLQFGAFTRLDDAEALGHHVAEADLSLLPLLTIVREAGLHRTAR